MARLITGLVVCALLTPFLAGDDVDKPVQGKVQIGIQKATLQPDFAYVVKLTAKGSSPKLVIHGLHSSRLRPDDPAKDGDQHAITNPPLLSPLKEKVVEIRVIPQLDTPAGPQEYTLTVERHKLAAKPVFEIKDKLTDKDRPMPDEPIVKDYPLKLVQGHLYVAELDADSTTHRVWPVFWREGNNTEASTVYRNDQPHYGVPFRSVFRPNVSENYKLSVTALEPDFKGPCSFTLKVYEEARTEP